MTLKVLAVVIITLILISIKVLNIFVAMGIHVPLNVWLKHLKTITVQKSESEVHFVPLSTCRLRILC